MSLRAAGICLRRSGWMPDVSWPCSFDGVGGPWSNESRCSLLSALGPRGGPRSLMGDGGTEPGWFLPRPAPPLPRGPEGASGALRRP